MRQADCWRRQVSMLMGLLRENAERSGGVKIRPLLYLYYSAACGAGVSQPFSRVSSDTMIITAKAAGADTMAG